MANTKQLLMVGALAALTTTATAQTDEDIKIFIDAPQPNTTVADINAIRGWAIHPNEFVGAVEIYIDGQFFSEVPVGGSRYDVYTAFPRYLNSQFSGYSQTVNFKEFEPGVHSLEVVAYTLDGEYNIAESNFCVDKFISEFIKDPEEIRMTTVSRIHIWTDRFIFEGVQIEGKAWNVEMTWNTATQGFEITNTTPYKLVDENTTYSCSEQGYVECQGTWCTEAEEE